MDFIDKYLDLYQKFKADLIPFQAEKKLLIEKINQTKHTRSKQLFSERNENRENWFQLLDLFYLLGLGKITNENEIFISLLTSTARDKSWQDSLISDFGRCCESFNEVEKSLLKGVILTSYSENLASGFCCDYNTLTSVISWSIKSPIEWLKLVLDNEKNKTYNKLCVLTEKAIFPIYRQEDNAEYSALFQPYIKIANESLKRDFGIHINLEKEYKEVINLAKWYREDEELKELEYKVKKKIKPNDYAYSKQYLTLAKKDAQKHLIALLYFRSLEHQFIDKCISTLVNSLKSYDRETIDQLLIILSYYTYKFPYRILLKILKIYLKEHKLDDELRESISKLDLKRQPNIAYKLNELITDNLEDTEKSVIELFQLTGLKRFLIFYSSDYYSDFGIESNAGYIKDWKETFDFLTPIIPIKVHNSNGSKPFYGNKSSSLEIKAANNSYIIGNSDWPGDIRTDTFLEDINKILYEQKVPYQLAVFVYEIHPLRHRRRNTTYYEAYINPLTQNQFDEIKNDLIDFGKFPELEELGINKNLNFYPTEKEPMSMLLTPSERKKLKEAKLGDNKFLNDESWLWFKQQYIDQFENAKLWYELMHWIVSFPKSGKASQKWMKGTYEAIKPIGYDKYIDQLSVLINDSLEQPFWFEKGNERLMFGFVCSCTFEDNQKAAYILQNVGNAGYKKIRGVGATNARIGNAALNALVIAGTPEAFNALSMMRAKTKYTTFQKALDIRIKGFAANSKWSVEELADRVVPGFDIKEGKVSILFGEHSATIIPSQTKTSIQWISKDGKTYKSFPKAWKDYLPVKQKEIKGIKKDIVSTIKNQLKRVQQFWLDDRVWEVKDWKKFFLEQPLMRIVVQNLIWRMGEQTFVLHNERLVGFQDQVFTLPSTGEVTLWHPVTATSEEMEGWKDFLFENKVKQAFRQVFREAYPKAATEMNATESLRFADHFLEVNKLYAIAPTVNWEFKYVHEGYNRPRQYVSSQDFTVHFNTAGYSRFTAYFPTKEIYFEKGDTRKINGYRNIQKKKVKIKISEIPTIVFSELMRDIDLFIATCTVANDPVWESKIENWRDYEKTFNYGKFSKNASAKVRKEIIEILLPILKIDTKVSIEGNYVEVKGKLNTYKINLGSGHAMIKSSNKHLNIMPAAKTEKSIKRKAWFPVEDDSILYLILGKCLLLMDDDKIEIDGVKDEL